MSDPATNGIALLLYKYVWIPLLIVLGKMFMDESWKRSFRERIQALETKLSVTQTEVVKETRIREIVEGCVKQLREDYSDLRVDFKEVAENVVELRIEVASGIIKGRQDGS